ncbi:AAA family ATPase [Candidatus Palauibacter sp.]|uniref:AAA family ATPase n=1 Tax=Candidatus Palauibacter sp. TaxID=3101350 RepID=UPI003B0275D8
MSHEQPENRLHLPDLRISGFRGIEALSIRRLGRVTLLAGRNGVGKTTVLEAVRVFAARGRYATLSDLLENREEFASAGDDDGDKVHVPDFAALFHGRRPVDQRIAIGPVNGVDQVTIQRVALDDEQLSLVERVLPEAVTEMPVHALKAAYGKAEQIFPLPSGMHKREHFQATRLLQRAFRDSNGPPGIRCESLGPGLLGNHDISRFWRTVALTDHEDAAVEALRLVLGGKVDRVAVLGEDRAYRHRGRAIVRRRDQSRPVPLKSLGDGAVRLFGVALALANSRDGFLLIDEAENGIHHSIQRDFWRMLLKTAHANNVQVLATTHSSDCIRGFAQASNEFEEIEGTLSRITRRKGETWAVEYSEKDLRIAAEQGTEVR